MPIDRGELRYNIRLTTGQTFRNLRKFRDELKLTRTEFRGFRADLQVAARSAAAAGAGLDRTATGLARINKEVTRKQLLAQQIKDARRLRVAMGRVVSELVKVRRTLGAIREASRASTRAMERTGRAAERAGRRGQRGFRRLRHEMAATRTGADRLAFSFVRMGGIISGFLIARSVLGGLRAIIEESIEFSRTIERAELGISALLIAVGEIRSAFGESVDQVQQLTLAENTAREQLVNLRRDALTTAATFRQLVDTFQIALAPGLAAGLDVDEVRRFTLRVSQAALALGVAQNQLSEEIRSILSGTIRPQTTRIAVALGITNEQIRRARELGELATFLEDRFAAFGVAGTRALDTIDGLVGRVIDGFGQVTGEAGRATGFFDRVKDILRDTLDLFIDIDEFGFPQPDPQTLEVLSSFFERINEGVDLLRQEFESITFDQAVAAARDLADAVIVSVQVIIGAAQGLGDAFGFVAGIVRGVADALGFEEGERSIREIARLLTGIFVSLVVTRTVLGVILGILIPAGAAVKVIFTTFALIVPVLVKIGGLLSKVLIPLMARLSVLTRATLTGFAAMPTAIQALVGGIGRFATTALKTVGIIGGLLFGLRELIRFFTGIGLNVEEFFTVIGASLERFVINAKSSLEITTAEILNFLANVFNKFSEAILEPIVRQLSKLVFSLADIGNRLGLISQQAFQDASDFAARFEQGTIRLGTINIDAIRESYEEAFEENDRLFREIERRNAERTKAAIEEENKQGRAAEETSDSIISGLESQDRAAKTLLETIEQITTTFSTARGAIQQTADATQRLFLALQQIELEERFAVDPDVRGLAGQAQTLVQSEQIRLEKELVTIKKERAQIEQRLTLANQSRLSSDRALASLTREEQVEIGRVERAVREIVRLRQEEAGLVSEATAARTEERAAINRGDREQLQAAREKRAQLTAQIEALRTQREEQEALINQTAQRGILDEEGLRFLQARLQAYSQELSLEKDLQEIQEAINKLQERSNEVLRRRLEILAQRGLRTAQAENREMEIQLGLAREINRIERQGGATGADIRLAQLRAQTQELQNQANQNLERIFLQIQSLEKIREQTDATSEENAALDRQIDLLYEQLGLQRLLSQEQIEKQRREEERSRILSKGTTGEAIALGAQDFIEQLGTVQEQLAQLTTNLLNTFTQGITQGLVRSLVSAFDEAGRFSTEKFLAGLRQAAGQLLQSIAQQLLQTAINSLITTLFGGAQTAAGIRVASAITAAEIEIAAAQTAAAIRAGTSAIGGVGLASGGYVSPQLPQSTPPAGVPSSDRVSAYLTPGEYVQPKSIVDSYGLQVMEAMRQRLIDPGLLKGLVGLKKFRSFSKASSRGPGYAQGGEVSAVQSARTSIETQAAQFPDSPSGVPLAAVPMNDQTFEQQLAAGTTSFRRFLRRNAKDFDAILRGGRTGG